MGIWWSVVGALEHEFYDFPFSWEFHHPNWWTHIFQRGRYTTNQINSHQYNCMHYIWLVVSNMIGIIFHFIYGMSSQPHWLIFFKMVKTTNQTYDVFETPRIIVEPFQRLHPTTKIQWFGGSTGAIDIPCSMGSQGATIRVFQAEVNFR